MDLDLAEEPTLSAAPISSSVLPKGEIGLLDLLLVLAKHKFAIAKATAIVAVVTVIVVLIWPKTYTGKASMLPPQQNGSTASLLLGQLGPLASLASGAGGQELGLGDPRDIYVAMLQSRTVGDDLIRRFSLMNVYSAKFLTEAREDLTKNTRVDAGKDGLIDIEVDDHDPKRAADLANAYVDELRQMTQNLAVTEASRRRLIFEQQLKQSNEDLKQAEVEFQKTQEKTGLISLDGQAKMILDSIALARAQISEKQVELKAMKTFATAQNPDVIRTEQELSSLESQLANLEHNQTVGNGDVYVSTGKIPSIGLEYVRKMRDVKYYEDLYELLAQQYEAARIDEARDGAIIQVVDPAVVPEKRSRPKRTLMVLVAAFFAFVFSSLFAFGRELFERAKAEQDSAMRLRLLHDYAVTGLAGKFRFRKLF